MPLQRADAAPVATRGGSWVKPCGHGTTAISPRVPALASKRESSATPPSSPSLEAKKPFRSDAPSNAASSDSSAPSSRKNSREDVLEVPLRVNGVLKYGQYRAENGVADSEEKNLINQEAKYQSQLNELTKQLALRDAEASKLRFQMEELQRDVFAKSAGIDRLEAELNTARKETELVRQRIRHLETDLENYRRRNTDLADEVAEKDEKINDYETQIQAKINTLENIILELRHKIIVLEQELSNVLEEKRQLDEKYQQLLEERDNEKKKVAETLELATQQKQEIETKWKGDFEQLRTINIMKEQQLLDDFEWKLREVQKNCKMKLDDKDRALESRLTEAYKEAEEKMTRAEEMMKQLENIKSYEVEIKALRGLTMDQEQMLKTMKDQHEEMKLTEDSLRNETKKLRKLIELEKENLQHMQRIHHQEIVDKERTLQQTLNTKRIEIAMYWEERLLRECGRLKMELEQIHAEEKFAAMETARREKDEEMLAERKRWELKVRECLKEIAVLKKALAEKDDYYREEIVRSQTNTDKDILELRRLMDKIDMTHHDKYEKLVNDHEEELERINEENMRKIKETEAYWQSQIAAMRAGLDTVKEQLEIESREKVEEMIQQHRSELDAQWGNLIHQKNEAIRLIGDEYVAKYNTLEEQFYTQQKSHSQREVELLKTIDSLKNELQSKASTIEDLQNNCDTLEGGIQVLNNEIAQHGEQLAKSKKEADQKIRSLHDSVAKLIEKQENEKEGYRMKYFEIQKQSQETVDHLQKKCNCLTKLFEEVRQRYERRESRVEDLNKISDLKQVIAEQEKDLACLNEEKRYFQMRLMELERQLEHNASCEEDDYEDAETIKQIESQYKVDEPSPEQAEVTTNNSQPPQQLLLFTNPLNLNGQVSIPPTIVECDDDDDDDA